MAKLADLGLSKRLDDAAHLTATGQGFGTTHYMPYEQALNARKADGRSDIYALGATIYHVLTGEVPFTGETHLDVIEKKNQGYFAPASSLNDNVPPVLDQILARMLARDPRERYQTASELIVELERSHLAAPIPSFADPESAKNDPWVQACLKSSTEPTRLDLATPPQITPLPPQADVWQLRYRDEAGHLCHATLATDQVRERIRADRLAAGAELSRDGQARFLPLSAYVEFKELLSQRRSTPPRSGSIRKERRDPPPSRLGFLHGKQRLIGALCGTGAAHPGDDPAAHALA